MTDSEKYELVPMEHTFVLDVGDGNATLPLDTAKELTKGLAHINDLLGVSIKEKYTEEIEDQSGRKHFRTKFHPLMMKLFDEQRKRVDQIHKILGGALQQDIAKEAAKITAKLIFEARNKREVKDEAIEILESEYYEED